MKARWLGSLAWVLAVACGDEPPPAEAPATPASRSEVAPEPERGDELLRRAREGIRDGALPAELEQAVLGSTEPAHARARRVLLAMSEPATGEGEGLEPGADEGGEPPPLVPPAADAAPPPVDTGAPSSSTPSPRPRASGGPTRVGKLSFHASDRGTTLIIAGSSKLVVGVANQPSSGIVRIVVEKAEAAASVLTARPKVRGAEVTQVRQGRDTLQVTLRLEPGWTLGSVTPFSGGTKVHLLAPR